MAHQLTEPNTANPLLASKCQVSLNLWPSQPFSTYTPEFTEVMINSSKPRHYLQIPVIYNLASTKVSNSEYTSRLPHSRTMRSAEDKCDTMG